MPIAVTCTVCKTCFRVKEEHAGKKGKCPRCQTPLVIPVSDPPLRSLSSSPQPAAHPSTSPQLVLQEILQAFQGEIRPVRRTLLYRFGIVFLSFIMLLLPALYLILIGGVAYLVFHHATTNLPRIGQMRSYWALFFLYVGPLVIGSILLFFMIKPFLARRSRTVPLRSLEFGEEPLLFALVTRIARAVDAPEPKRIALDCQPNASAGFASFWGALLGGDLVLTLGLPLLAGLSIQQLAGVIAHELGHFSQGAGMRLSYLVRSLNLWFARLVYERDDWDESLAQGCERGDSLSLLLLLAIFCLWLTRRLLWLFMMLGHAFSCFMLRQMEYDADRVESRLAGASAFIETTKQLMRLNAATNLAGQVASQSWRAQGKLPEDLSGLIVRIVQGFSPEELRTIEQMEAGATGLFDTHPCNRDRCARVQQDNPSGIFHLEGSATRLVHDFPRLSRAVSLDFYRETIGKQVTRDALVPVEVVPTSVKQRQP